MKVRNTITRITVRLLLVTMSIAVIFIGIAACSGKPAAKKPGTDPKINVNSPEDQNDADESEAVNALLVSPKNPQPGQTFHVLAVGGKNIRKAKIAISAPSGSVESQKSRNGDGLPFWRIDEFKAGAAGKYKVSLTTDNKATINQEFWVTDKPAAPSSGGVWKTVRGWDGATEALYSAWINAMFYNADERSTWTALHEVTKNKDRNFLYNHL